jgi:hypothetical protein
VRLRRDKGTPEHLGNTFESLLRRWLSEEELNVYRACNSWPQVVGAKLAERCAPGEFSNGVLVVYVVNPVWLQELQFFKNEILRRLNERLGTPVIRDLVFRLAPSERRRTSVAGAAAGRVAGATVPALEPVELAGGRSTHATTSHQDAVEATIRRPVRSRRKRAQDDTNG